MNRLAKENSPYLLQHANNPVDWYPWGEEALTRARELDRPIFLSIGYAACHWCHVMERESFEDEAIAGLLNQHFVPIKVDREERPDIDDVYMVAVQLLTGAGGWPLSAWLTPELKPFFAGTYFPPTDAYGRPGFGTLLDRIARVWSEERPRVEQDAERVQEALRQTVEPPAAEPRLEPALVEAALADMQRRHDPRWGGFGHAPKFPPSMTLELALSHWQRSGDNELRQLLERTLAGMLNGGLYDQFGGGFHRYSVDERWLVPHFEKMLYDNALLVPLYARAWVALGEPRYRRAAEQTVAWLEREMTHPEGGFYSSLDADSEGEEGLYYTWTPDEVEQVLGREDAALVAELYDISASGNFEGRSIPHLPIELPSFAKARGLGPNELEQRLDALRGKLLARRRERVPPSLDDKVLTEWNGLMIGGLARAARLLERRDWVELAARATRFVLRELRPEGRLLRSWRDGSARVDAFQMDFAQLGAGLLELHRADPEGGWLEPARELYEEMHQRFHDPRNGGYYSTSDSHEQMIARIKDSYDGVVPSGNAQAAQGWLQLHELSGESLYRERAEATLASLVPLMSRAPAAASHALQVLDRYLTLSGVPAAEAGLMRSARVTASGQPLFEAEPRLCRSDSAADGWQLELELRVADGWHLNANAPGDAALVPTTLELDGEGLLEPPQLSYPEGQPLEAAFSDQALRVYTGRVTLTASLRARAGQPLRLKLNTQACDDSRCQLPETLSMELELPVEA